MNKRPLCGAAVLFICGIWAASVRAWYVYPAAAALFLIVSCSALSGFLFSDPPSGTAVSQVSFRNLFRFFHSFFSLPYTAYFLLLFYFLSAAGGYFLCLSAQINASWYEAYDLDGETAAVTGTVCRKEETDESQTLILCDVILEYDGALIRTNKIMIRTYTNDDTDSMQSYEIIKLGNQVCITGEISYFSEARNPGNFDALSYYRSKNIDFRITPASVEITNEKVFWYSQLMYVLKNRFQSVFRQVLSEDACGVLSTMVLGEDADLSDETRNLYQEAGISHILAISGLHVSIVGMLLYRFLRRRGVSYLWGCLPSALAVLSFGIMSGMGLAAQRAIIMFLLMLAADLLGFAYDSLSALSFAAILLLLRNPLLLFSASFLLSFSAVLGAVVLFPLLRSHLNLKHDTVLLSFSVQLATIPVTLFYYYEIPLFSLPANFILVPFVSILLVLGIAGGAAGLLFLPAARLILFPASLILRFYLAACELISQIPGHMLICGCPSWLQMVLYYALLAAAAAFLNLRPQLHGKKVFLSVLTVILLFLMIFRVPSSFRITMLDVGQGEGILVESGSMNVFIDGGSTDVSEVGSWRILPFLKYRGIRQIDLWFITHTDSDHCNGLEDLYADGYRIRYLVLAAGAAEDDSLAELVLLAEENGTEVLFLSQGTQITQGNAVWTLLFPADENDYTDANDASMVLLLRYGDFTALFTGDLTEESEADLLESGDLKKALTLEERISGIDLLKVAHHGSRYASSDAFLSELQPASALISAGVDNFYGHPAEETIIRLEAYTDEIYVTSETGAVTVTLQGAIPVFTTFLQE